MRSLGMAAKTKDLSLKETAPPDTVPSPQGEIVVIGPETEEKARFAKGNQLATKSEPPTRTAVSSTGRTLQLISKAESAPLKIAHSEAMEEAGHPSTFDCDPDPTDLGEKESPFESGGTHSNKPVAGSDVSLKQSESSLISSRLFLVAIAVIFLAFVAGIWLGLQTVQVRSARGAKKVVMKRAQTSVAPRDSEAPFPAPAPANHEPTAASEQFPLLAVTPEKLLTLPRVTGIRHWPSADFANIVVELEDQVQYEAHRLNSPDRIFFDLHNTQLAQGLAGTSLRVADPPIKRIRIAQPVVGTTRIVLEIDRASDFAVNLEANPYRLVIQVREIDQTLGKR